MIQIPEFKTKDELFQYLRQNKSLLYASKKMEAKFADAVSTHLFAIDNETGNISKASINPDILKMDSFKASVVINTTNLIDSHSDVHIPGIWNKSLKEQKNLYLLEEHKMSFRNIISDNVKAVAKMMSWKELGFDYEGETQALIFDAEIDKNRNEYMAEQYAKDRVKNHSVGMRYVKLALAINSESKFDKEEKAVWDKYINQIVNKEVAEDQGYFWAVTEAKVIEGSAVPLGSNFATPTISVGNKSFEPDNSTQEEPPIMALDYDKIADYLQKRN